MPLRICEDNQKKLPVAALEFNDLMILESALRLFQQKTGRRISEYGDLTPYPAHAQLLANLIKQHVISGRTAQIERLMRCLETAARKEDFLYFAGE